MKRKCKQCGKKHNRNKLDVMKALLIPNAFCSDFCHNAYLLTNKIGVKRTGQIQVSDSTGFKVGQMVKIEGIPAMVEGINGNAVEGCKYES